MSNNTNNGSNKPADRKKAAPSVPAASRSSRSGTKAETTPATPPAIKPAKSSGPLPNRPQTQMSARALSRYEKDMRRQRQLVWAVIGIVVFIVLVLAFGIWQTTLAPNFQTIAKVNDQSVSRSDYNKFRKLTIFKQVGQLQQQAQYSQGDQQTQINSQIALLQDELANVADRPVDQPTLEQMVNQIVLEKAAREKFNITVSDDEVNKNLSQQFHDVIYTPTANPTQAIQTQTAGPVATQGAQFGTATANAVTPLPTPTPSVPATTTVASVTASTTVSGTNAASTTVSGTTTATTPGVTAAGTAGAATTPGLTPGATPASTPNGTPGASPTVSTTATPQPTATATAIAADKVDATASASQSDYLKSFRSFTGLSDDDYRKLEVRPGLLRKKVIDRLQQDQPQVGQPWPSWKVSHILVKDEPTAKQIYDQLMQVKKDTPDKLESTFIQLARDKSTDTTAASHNGDLGWITDHTQFDKDFLAAALKLNKGDITAPVKTQFGFHIIYCTDKDDKRALDALTIQGFQQTDESGDPKFYGDWLKDRVKENTVTYNTPPTPAPTATLVPAPAFTPVVPPTATPLPTPTSAPVTTTVAAGTPGATTSASAGTPGGTTAAATTVSGTTNAVTTSSPTTSAAPTAAAPTTSSSVTTPSASTTAPSTTAAATP